MNQLPILPNIKHKTSFGSGAVGAGLGTFFVSLVPHITADKSIQNNLLLLSPIISVICVYITRFILSQVKLQYLVWAAQKIENRISNMLCDSSLSPEHVQNLKKKREQLQINQITILERALLNDEDISLTTTNNVFKRKAKL